MSWRLPLADVDIDEDERQAIAEVLNSKWLTMGAATQQFEAGFSALTGIEHAIAVTNGTAALHLALVALGIGAGDEVIVPALSFVATANAVRYTGATPIFADIHSLDDLTIAPESIQSKLTPRTKAIVVMHYGGYACDMPRILEIAHAHHLFVVEDAAHALGTWLEGRHMGGWGDLGCFSFFPNKNITTAEGGMVTARDPALAQRVRLLRSHGMTSLTWDRHAGHAWSYDVVDLGYNYRIDELRAALGMAQLKKLVKSNQKRRELTGCYRQQLAAEAPHVRLPFEGHRGEAACHILPVLLPPGSERIAIMEKMKQAGIQTSIHYPPIHRFTYYQQTQAVPTLEITEEAARRELTLPLFPQMTPDDVRLVVRALAAALA